MDSYAAIAELPVGARQALKVGAGIAAVSKMVLLVALVQRWPRHRLLAALYLLTIVLSFDPNGERTVIVTGFLSVAIAWHVLVRPIRTRFWLGAAVVGLILFLALGTRRNVGHFTQFGLLPSEGVGEFDALWANGLELARAREAGHFHVGTTTRFGELWAFVPSQILPFEKTSLSNWFVETYHHDYAAQGGGLAFGAIAQAVIGGGVVEALVRGAILGALAAWVMRWYRRSTASWWRFPLYLYFLIFVYQSIRDTTFRSLTELVQVALPALVLVGILGRFFARRSTGR
jgi:hypothetical protein